MTSPLPTATTIAADVRAGRRSATSVCEQALARIAAIDGRLHAFLEVTADHARRRAADVDAAIAAGRNPGPLAGVPVAVKDNICTTFSRTTCGSRILGNYRSPYDATAVQRIEAAGAVIVGKTNLDEFAMGSSTENSAFQKTVNPWHEGCVPGGSSGGAAAAVAARIVPMALGSDTGGSIRQPAAFCGVVGLKPTYGRVSRYGLIAYGSSFDQVGPIATTVEDAALLLAVIAGKDAADSTSVEHPVDAYPDGLCGGESPSAQKLRIGVPAEYFGDGLHAEVRAAVESAIETLRSTGGEVFEVSLPRTEHAIAAYYLIVTAECSSNLARYDGVHYGQRSANHENILDLYSASREEGFGAEVKRRIMLGTFALSAGYYDAYYNKALQVRRLVREDFDRVFEHVDVLACPATPTPAFALGAKLDDPLEMYLADVYTVAANLAGIPGISVPCGFSAAGLPIGLQLLGPVFGEQQVLRAGHRYQCATDWHTRLPT